MKMISDLLITALFTVFIQNLVLNSGLGISEAIRVSTKPGTFGKIAGMISGFSVVTSVICSALNSTSNFANLPFAGKAAVYSGVLAAVYLLVALLLKLIFRASDKLLGTLGIAALNTLVFAVPFINQSAAYSFADAIGSGIGAGIHPCGGTYQQRLRGTQKQRKHSRSIQGHTCNAHLRRSAFPCFRRVC